MPVLDDANNYINAQYGPTYSAWMLLSDDDKSRTLTTSTRFIDSFQWQGTATGIVGALPTSLQWPRTGVFVDGVELDPTTVPPQVVQACFELAVMIADDPSLTQNADAGSNLRSMGASGANLAFFRPTSAADGSAPRFPPLIDRLIGRFLASNVASMTGFSSGVNPCSNFQTLQPVDLNSTVEGGTVFGGAEQRRDVGWPV